MSFTERAATAPAPKVTPCLVRDILDTLPTDEAAVLRGWLAEPMKRRSHVKIADETTDEGYPISDYTIGRHRNNRCSCRFLVSA